MHYYTYSTVMLEVQRFHYYPLAFSTSVIYYCKRTRLHMK